MGYTIRVEVEPTERAPRFVVRLAGRFSGTVDKTDWSDYLFKPTIVEFDNWRNFLGFADSLIGQVQSIAEEPHLHWVAANGATFPDGPTAGTPFWAYSRSDGAQVFHVSPPHAAKEVAKFIRQYLTKRALGGEEMAESVVRNLLND